MERAPVGRVEPGPILARDFALKLALHLFGEINFHKTRVITYF
jgi:hypothetical protein